MSQFQPFQNGVNGARNDTLAAAGYKSTVNGYDAGMDANLHPQAFSRHSAAGRRLFRALGTALVTAIIAAVFAPPLAAQPRLAQGMLLLASPEIDDPSWTRTVVLLLHHDSNGSLGVALNRPTRVAPEEVEPQLELPGYSGSVFRGGPVGPTQLIFLVRNPPAGLLRAAPQIVEDVYASGDLSALTQLVELGTNESELRLFAGHVEWAPRQLEAEVAEGLWTLTAASSPRVFPARPETLWEQLQASGDELLVDTPIEPRLSPASALDPGFSTSVLVPMAGNGSTLSPLQRIVRWAIWSGRH